MHGRLRNKILTLALAGLAVTLVTLSTFATWKVKPLVSTSTSTPEFNLGAYINDMNKNLTLLNDKITKLDGAIYEFISMSRPDGSSLRHVQSQLRVNGSQSLSLSDYPIIDGVIDPRKFRYRINTPRDLCKNGNLSMFVYVHSAAANHERRRILRNTWANKDLLKKLNVGFVFITGITPNDSKLMERIQQESVEYGDIVQTEYVDTYPNISIKSTASLNWAALYCAPYVPVILKSDDDIFVNITRLMDYVRIDLPKIISGKGDKLILCNLWQRDGVVRLQGDRYYIPEELYGETHYPPFCQGSALIMTSKAVIETRHALIGARFFPLDDVLLTAFTAPKAGVSLIPINKRHLSPNKNRNITTKELRSNFIFAHSSIPNLLKLWDITTRVK